MNLHKMEKRGPLAPLRRLAGKKTPRLSVQDEVFLLTSPFIERAYRTCGVLELHMSGNGVYQELVHCCEERAAFNNAILAFSADAHPVRHEAYCYQVLLVLAGTLYDSDLRDIVLF
jgi:hypothetical protein